MRSVFVFLFPFSGIGRTARFPSPPPWHRIAGPRVHHAVVMSLPTLRSLLWPGRAGTLSQSGAFCPEAIQALYGFFSGEGCDLLSGEADTVYEEGDHLGG